MTASRPLDGVRVLDLSRVLSGPCCGKALADLGADVVKVEPPEGDFTRTAQPRRGGVALYFAQQNCGKRCISLDLRVPDGQRVALELAARSDIVLENFRPGVMTRLGLDWDQARALNPRLIYVSASGYGDRSPYRERPGQDLLIQAVSGLASISGRGVTWWSPRPSSWRTS